ncbi:pcpR [Symbiodinium microadriaticum]|nr:pcpR [Symbiodinium microadriaticum]
MGLSQSAISHALARLRDLFNDPLFIRHAHGLEPTRRALELAPRIETLLQLAGETLKRDAGFDPTASRRRFHIAWHPTLASTAGAALIRSFADEAPGAMFASRPLLLDQAMAALRRGDVDLAVGIFPTVAPGLVADYLFTDAYCVLARKGHPEIKGTITLDQYIRTPHIIYGAPKAFPSDEPHYDPDQIREAYGRLPEPDEVNILGYVNQWETAIIMAAESDAIVDCPSSLAKRFAKPLGLQILDTPYPSPSRDVSALYRQEGDDPGRMGGFIVPFRRAQKTAQLLAVPVNQQGRGQAEHAQFAPGVRTFINIKGKGLSPGFGQKVLRNLWPCPIKGNGDHLKVITTFFFLQGVQAWHFMAAGTAPGCPKIDQQDLPLKIREADITACPILKLHF